MFFLPIFVIQLIQFEKTILATDYRSNCRLNTSEIHFFPATVWVVLAVIGMQNTPANRAVKQTDLIFHDALNGFNDIDSEYRDPTLQRYRLHGSIATHRLAQLRSC